MLPLPPDGLNVSTRQERKRRLGRSCCRGKRSAETRPPTPGHLEPCFAPAQQAVEADEGPPWIGARESSLLLRSHGAAGLRCLERRYVRRADPSDTGGSLVDASVAPRVGLASVHACAYTPVVAYLWDTQKARANLRKHRVHFPDAVGVFEDPEH